MSSWNGLSSYDGHQFRHYKPTGDLVKPMHRQETINRDIRINAIHEDDSGNIICITRDNRVYAFHPGESCFYDFSDLYGYLPSTDKEAQIVLYSLPKHISYLVSNTGDIFRNSSGNWLDVSSTTVPKLGNWTYIYSIQADAFGDEWILTDKGIYIVGEKQFENRSPFVNFCETTNGVFLTTGYGLAKFYSFQHQVLFDVPMPEQISYCPEIKLLHDGRIALCTDKGLLLSRPESGEYLNICDGIAVFSVFEDKKGNLWLFTSRDDGVYLYETEGQVLRPFLKEPKDQGIKSFDRQHRLYVTEDPYGTLWVVTKNAGLSYYDKDSESLQPLYLDQDDPKSILSISCRRYLRDEQHNLWITGANSLVQIQFKKQTTQLWSYPKKEISVRSLYVDRQNRIWTATKAGVIRIYAPDDTLIGYLSKTGEIQPDYCSFGDRIYSIMEDMEGRFWLASRKNGLYLLYPKTGGNNFHLSHFKHDKADPFSLSHNDAFTLFQDKKGHIYVGCHHINGINLVDFQEDGSIRFYHPGNLIHNWPAMEGGNIRSFAEDHDGNVVVGTTKGLFCFSSDFKRPEDMHFYIHIRKNEAGTAKDNDVVNVFVNSEGRLFALYRTGALGFQTAGKLLSDNEATFNYYEWPESDHLKDACSMVEDQDGNIWVVLENALSKFTRGETIPELTYMTTLTGRDLIMQEATVSKNQAGHFLIGCEEGVLEVFPDEIQKDSFMPSIIISDVHIHEEERSRTIDMTKALKLKPTQRSITIRYAALDFKDAGNIRYAYLMEGLEKEWHYVNNQHEATYINLPKGQYFFKLRSTNSDGVWSHNETALNIQRLPTFWETGWALALYILIGLLTFVLILQFFLEKGKIKMERNLTEDRIRFFTDISHDLRTPLSLISSPIDDILHHETLSEAAHQTLSNVQKNCSQMLTLINQVLDFRKIQNHKMKLTLEEIDAVKCTAGIMETFRLSAQERNIPFNLETDEGDEGDKDAYLIWVDFDKFQKMVMNLLSNAFKYTPDEKAVTVKITQSQSRLTIQISDEGIGIPPSKINDVFERFETAVSNKAFTDSSGIGLSLVQEFIELHHGGVSVTSEEGKGTTFSLIFLKGKQIFEADSYVEYCCDSISDLPEYIDQVRSKDGAETADTVLPLNLDEEKDLILVVEDKAEMREYISNILSPEYQVETVCNGKEGLETAIHLLPSLILSDVMMPEMDGIELLKELKKNEETRSIPFVFLTAKAAVEDAVKGLDIGAVDYIAKPFNSTYLNARLRKILHWRKEMMEYCLKQYEGNAETDQHLQISESDKDFVYKTIEYIEKHMDRVDLKVEELADYLCVSHSSLYRRIKSAVGFTPVALINHVRVNHAAKLIKEGKLLSMAEISDACGFGSQAYFCVCFKRQMGVSPTQYK